MADFSLKVWAQSLPEAQKPKRLEMLVISENKMEQKMDRQIWVSVAVVGWSVLLRKGLSLKTEALQL